MSTELICPDCGGIIGSDGSDPGRACTCISNSTSATVLGTEPDASGDTFVEKTETPKAKVCCQCGKDLSGHRRLRDSRGYWCYACHKLDKEANKPKGTACADCGRVVPDAALSDYEGQLICGTCRERQKQEAKERRRLSPVKTTAHDVAAKKNLYVMLGVVAVLLIIILLRTFHVIGS
jgi:hypothetical protein